MEVKVYYNLVVLCYVVKVGKCLFVLLNVINNWEYILFMVKNRKYSVFRDDIFWNRDEIIMDILEGF